MELLPPNLDRFPPPRFTYRISFFLIHRSVWSNLNSAKDGEILRGSDAQPSSPASDLARRVLTGDAVGPSCGARVTKAAALVSSFPTATSTGANFRGKDGMSQEWRGREMQQPFCGVICTSSYFWRCRSNRRQGPPRRRCHCTWSRTRRRGRRS